MAASQDPAVHRLTVSFPATIESIGPAPVALLPPVASVFHRVAADETTVGATVYGTVRDLSSNGAFVSCEPLPLLSRVLLSFELGSYGPVEAVAWVMWARVEDVTVDGGGYDLVLPRGVGLVFESMAVEARAAIARLAAT